MKPARQADAARVLRQLVADPAARLVADGAVLRFQGGTTEGRSGPTAPLSPRAAALLAARGLLTECAPGQFAASPEAAAWLKRLGDGETAFRRQHHVIAPVAVDGEPGRSVLKNLEESAVAALARRTGKSGEAWLQPHAIAAAERLRRDFEIGQLQPRITANWTASVASRRRSGETGTVADITEAAMAARLRLDRAMQALGPELSGTVADVCCFLKGLETVERERQWPARSAKLVLRLGLEALARHYGLRPAAAGNASATLRHWGAEDYRPKIS